jgi:tetratricopeptide (TPR) repeat protein
VSKAIASGSADTVQLYYLLAQARVALGYWQGAQEAFTLALEEKPDDLGTWRAFFLVSQNCNQWDAILAGLDRRIDRLGRLNNPAPDEVAPLRLLRAKVLHEGYGANADAEHEFLSLAEQYPRRVDLWSAFHAFAKATGRETTFNGCLAHAMTAPAAPLDLPPVLSAVSLGLGDGGEDVAVGVSRLEDAFRARQAARATTDDLKEQFSWAADVLAARVEQNPPAAENAGGAWLSLGLLYGALDDFDAAARLLERAAPQLSGERLTLCLIRRGTALSALGKTGPAVDAFERAVASAPKSFEARHALARALAHDGQLARARFEYQSMLVSFELDHKGRAALQKELDALPR